MRILDSINMQQCSSSNKFRDYHGISKIGKNDVVLGRGSPTTNHEGNITFRHIVKQYKRNYLCARNNYEKYLITMEVQQKIKSLSPPGRFIRRDSKTNTWIEIDDDQIRQKISQALREKVPSVMKCHTNSDVSLNNQKLTNAGDIYKNICVQNDKTSANNDSNSLKASDADKGNIKTSVPRKKSNLQKQNLFSQIGGYNYNQYHGAKAVLNNFASHEKCLIDEQKCKSSYYEDNKAGMSKDIVKSMVDFPLETVMDIKSLITDRKGAITSAAKTSVELHIASSTTSIPLEPGPSTEMPSTNNVDRMNKASLVARRKRSNSELSVDGLALLASTVIAEWDHNGQHKHRRKMPELGEMNIV